MMSFNLLLKFVILFLFIFPASLVLAADDQTNTSQDAIAERVWPTHGTPLAALIDITTAYAKGKLTDIKGEDKAPVRGEAPLDGATDFSKKYFGERSTFTVFEGGETRWGLAPLSDKFSLNPMTDIMNLEVLLQYKF